MDHYLSCVAFSRSVKFSHIGIVIETKTNGIATMIRKIKKVQSRLKICNRLDGIEIKTFLKFNERYAALLLLLLSY